MAATSAIRIGGNQRLGGNTFVGDADPTVDNDASSGAFMGDRFVNQVSGRLFVCFGATAGAATWREFPAATALAATRTAFVDVNGSDSSGTIGRVDKPYQTIRSALTACNAVASVNARHRILVGPGDFALGNNVLNLEQYVSLFGSGRGQTTITSTADLTVSGKGCIVHPKGFSDLGYLTVQAVGSGVYQGCFGTNVFADSDGNCNGVRVFDCDFIGNDTDSVFFQGFSGTVDVRMYGCTGSSKWDVVRTTFGGTQTVVMYDCEWTGTGPSVLDPAGNASTKTRVLAHGRGIMKMFGGRLVASGGVLNNYGVYTDGGALSVYGTEIDATGTGAFDAANSSGSIRMSGVTRADGAAVTSTGTVSLPSLQTSSAAAATTPGSVVKKIQVFDQAGTSLGFVPVYSAIT